MDQRTIACPSAPTIDSVTTKVSTNTMAWSQRSGAGSASRVIARSLGRSSDADSSGGAASAFRLRAEDDPLVASELKAESCKLMAL